MAALCVMTTVVVPSSALTCGEGLEHDDARGDVEGAGRLVAQQDRRPLGDGARNRHALLLAARELRRKMVAPRCEIDQLQRRLRRHRVVGDLGDERDILRAPSGWE